MGFGHLPQWVRHKAVLKVDATQGSAMVRMQCARCGVELPTQAPLNSIVLTKEDRLYLGDDPRATDCR